MKPFTSMTGIAAPLMRINVDTDAIIPSREMKRVSKQGLADGLFAGWRYRAPDSRTPDPDFVLNREPYDKASVLLSGHNFGCGSSREHAVWALAEWGIRAIIAPSFGSIFQGNCLRNGVLPVVLDASAVDDIAARVQENPASNRVTVDLHEKRVRLGQMAWPFEIAEKDRQVLLLGLDFIAATLKSEAEITAFESRDRLERPWAYL